MTDIKSIYQCNDYSCWEDEPKIPMSFTKKLILISLVTSPLLWKVSRSSYVRSCIKGLYIKDHPVK